MINREGLELYMSEGFIRSVEENLGRDPLRIALDRTIPDAGEVATRVKYFRRARTKLPSYYAARCIIPARAYEQSSGERSAFARGYGGGLCVDLTCGLGVDSFALSRGFDKVITVEPDPILAEIARYNFGLLKADNVEVINSTAEEFLALNPDLKVDIIYADPDRRDGKGRRVAAPGECSPDVTALMPRLKEMAGTVAVKLSPLFDVREAFRLFGDRSRVIAVSDGGECKEVLIETGRDIAGGAVVARILGRGEEELPYPDRKEENNPPVDINSLCRLVVPDVALVKTGAAVRYYSRSGFYMPSEKGYAYGMEDGCGLYGRHFRIISREAYSPKKMRKNFKDRQITRMNLMVRDFPEDAPAIARQLGIKEGGTMWAAFTTFGGVRYCLFLEPVGSG